MRGLTQPPDTPPVEDVPAVALAPASEAAPAVALLAPAVGVALEPAPEVAEPALPSEPAAPVGSPGPSVELVQAAALASAAQKNATAPR